MPKVMIAQKQIEIEIVIAEVFLKSLKGLLIRQNIYLLSVMKQIAQKYNVLDFLFNGCFENPIQDLNAMIESFR